MKKVFSVIFASSILVSCTPDRGPVAGAPISVNLTTQKASVMLRDGTRHTADAVVETPVGQTQVTPTSAAISSSQDKEKLALTGSGTYARYELKFGRPGQLSLVKSGSESSFTYNTTLQENVDYSYELVPFDSAGKAGNRIAGTVRFDKAAVSLAKITSAEVSQNGLTSVKLRANGDNISGDITYKIGDRTFTGSPGSEISVDGLTADTNYVALITAKNSAGVESEVVRVAFRTLKEQTQQPTDPSVKVLASSTVSGSNAVLSGRQLDSTVGYSWSSSSNSNEPLLLSATNCNLGKWVINGTDLPGTSITMAKGKNFSSASFVCQINGTAKVVMDSGSVTTSN